MLTAVSTVLGMIPIAPTVFWGPMAFAIMGGLLVATLLTLVFLPTLYVTAFERGARTPAPPAPRRTRGGEAMSRVITRHPRSLAAGACRCSRPAATGRTDEAAKGRPVGVVVIEPSTLTRRGALTGDIQARKDVDAAFRIGGRVIERKVKIGDASTAGQVSSPGSIPRPRRTR